MPNEALAKIFFEIAELLEMKNVPWKPAAYRAAALSIQNLPEPIETIYARGGDKALKEISKVGEAISKKIIEYIETGKVTSLESLRKRTGIDIVSLKKVSSLGPKRLMLLKKELGVKDLKTLKKAARQHKIALLPGFGKRSEAQILAGIALAEGASRIPFKQALSIAESIKQALSKCRAVLKVEVAGSVRRKKPTIGDVDVLVSTNESEKVMDFFTSLSNVNEVIMKGSTKSSVRVVQNVQVDVRAVKPGQWGSALMYFTGSKMHNIELRKIAMKKGLKLNEYGLFKGDKVIASQTEKDIYEALGRKYLPPDKRE